MKINTRCTYSFQPGFASALLMLASSSLAAGQDSTLDEVIVTANRPTSVGKLDVPLMDQPMNVTLISAESLETLGKPRLEDIASRTVGLQAVAPALGVTNYGFFVRGFNGAPTIVDGYYSSVNAFGSVGVFDMATVESVEVLRGPASLLYGQGNPGGIVNLTTKKPRDVFGAALDVFGDEHGARRIEGDVTGPVADFATLRAVGVLEDSDTFRDFVTHERQLIAPTLFIDAGERADIKLSYVYDRLKYGADNGPGFNADLIANLPVERNIGEPWLEPIVAVNQSLRAEIDVQLADEWTARAGYFANRGRTPDGTREIDADVTDSGTLIYRTFNQTAADKNGADNYMITAQLLGKLATGALDHTLTAAIDYIDNRTKYDYEVSGIDTLFDYAHPQYSNGLLPMTFWYGGEGAFRTYVRAAYVQDLFSIGDRWKALIGVRRDDIATVGYFDAAATLRYPENSDEQATTPRVGVVYEPTDRTTLYASFSEAFVPLIGSDRFDNPFKPEESRSYELGVRQQFGGRLLLTATVYDIEKKNIIVVDPADTNYNINAGVARSQGFELEVGGRITEGWRVNAGLAYTDARIEESVDPDYFPEGDRLPAAARWSALLNTRYRFGGALNGLEIGGNIAYTGERQYMVPNTERELDAYTRIDVFASYEWSERFELQVNINNLTDERILLANGYGRAHFDPPRTMGVSVRYKTASLAN